jgi:hypothetical protein
MDAFDTELFHGIGKSGGTGTVQIVVKRST